MELSVGQKLYGFTVTRARKAEELSGTLYEMTHDKTGAQLCWMDNGEMNKLFSVAFKTLPEDDTGVFHILEHSVLCGSEKYPVKEPFVDLMKSSMNTFLNAITFSDKTMYPVSSRNEQDFLNLMGVYLDAVFAPNCIHDPNIFYQEGWHVELGEENALSYKGVVFNEMKGATAGLDRALYDGSQSIVFPDNCYRFESGGEPAAIPDLTYARYCETYKRFYHPSNARIYLDGTVPLDKTLAEINGYLSRYERSEETHEIPMQIPVARELTQHYEVAKGESKNKAALSLARILCPYTDKVKVLAARVLCSFLAETNESPLKKAILSAKLAENMDTMVWDGLQQPLFLLNIRNTEPEKEPAIRSTIRTTAESLLEKGLDKDALTACLNRLAFQIKEPQEPAGLMRNFDALASWLYGGDPMLYLCNDEAIEQLRQMVNNGGFDALLRELLLDESTLCVLHTLPSETLGEEKKQKEQTRLEALKAGWSEKDWAELRSLNDKLKAWQNTPDAPEQTATLPILSLEEIGEELEYTETLESRAAGVTVLYHPVPTNGIVHMKAYVSLADKSLEELRDLSLLKDLLGNLPTASHPETAMLQQQVRSLTGRMEFSMKAYAPAGENEGCKPVLAATCSVLEENLLPAAALMREILTETRFTDKESIRSILLKTYEEKKQNAIMYGHQLAFAEALAHVSAQGAVQEAFSGYSALQALRALTENFEERIPALTALYEDFVAHSVCRARMTFSLTASHPVETEPLLEGYPQGTAVPELGAYTADLPRKLGICIPAQVGFSSQGLGAGRSGSLRVTAQMLSLDYLWNVVRVQGGAYGAGLVNRGENVFTYSFRDPTPAKTLHAYAGMAEALEEYCAGKEALDKYIISTVAEPLRSPLEKGAQADEAWFSGLDRADAVRLREEILHTTKEKMLAWKPLLERLAKEGPLCLVGPKAALEDVEGLETREL